MIANGTKIWVASLLIAAMSILGCASESIDDQPLPDTDVRIDVDQDSVEPSGGYSFESSITCPYSAPVALKVGGVWRCYPL